MVDFTDYFTNIFSDTLIDKLLRTPKDCFPFEKIRYLILFKSDV